MITEPVDKQVVPTVADKISNPDGLLVDIKEAALFMGITPWRVRGLITDGELPVVWVRNKQFLRKKTLSRWVERSEETR